MPAVNASRQIISKRPRKYICRGYQMTGSYSPATENLELIYNRHLYFVIGVMIDYGLLIGCRADKLPVALTPDLYCRVFVNVNPIRYSFLKISEIFKVTNI